LKTIITKIQTVKKKVFNSQFLTQLAKLKLLSLTTWSMFKLRLFNLCMSFNCYLSLRLSKTKLKKKNDPYQIQIQHLKGTVGTLMW